jgi:hypothetical protein
MTDLILETGKVKLRCGYKVRIHATDLYGPFPVLASYLSPEGWLALRNSLNGKHSSDADDHSFDLVPIPKAKYFNIYTYLIGGTFMGAMWDSIAEANQQVDKSGSIDFYETFQYLDGDITKVEPEGDEQWT